MTFFSNLLSRYVGPYLKAHIAGLGAGVSLLVADTHGNLNNLSAVTGNQWVDALIATGLLGGLVGLVANRPAAPVAPAAPAPVAVPIAVAPAASQDSGA